MKNPNLFLRKPSKKPAIGRKSESGQAQIVTALLFLFLIPAGMIIAQNATNITTSLEGNVILNETTKTTIKTEELAAESTIHTNITKDNSSYPDTNQTQNKPSEINLTINTTKDKNVTENGIKNKQENLNKTNQRPLSPTTTSNQTLSKALNGTNTTLFGLSEQNETLNETKTFDNQTLYSNDTLRESTVFQNKTLGNQSQINKAANSTIPSREVYLTATIAIPNKITRGKEVQFLVVLKNTGNATARSVTGQWVLPEGFEAEQVSFSCGDIEPESACSNVINVQTTHSTNLGESRIEVLVSYAE